jgi:hypothetical protein
MKVKMILAAGLLSVAACVGTVNARMLIMQATAHTTGCDSYRDFSDLFNDPQHHFMTALNNKLTGGKCFSIDGGSLAYWAPEWQVGPPAIGVYKTQSGRKFHSFTYGWKYYGETEAPKFVP